MVLWSFYVCVFAVELRLATPPDCNPVARCCGNMGTWLQGWRSHSGFNIDDVWIERISGLIRCPMVVQNPLVDFVRLPPQADALGNSVPCNGPGFESSNFPIGSFFHGVLFFLVGWFACRDFGQAEATRARCLFL